jgi:hypothetical protein
MAFLPAPQPTSRIGAPFAASTNLAPNLRTNAQGSDPLSESRLLAWVPDRDSRRLLPTVLTELTAVLTPSLFSLTYLRQLVYRDDALHDRRGGSYVRAQSETSRSPQGVNEKAEISQFLGCRSWRERDRSSWHAVFRLRQHKRQRS